MPLYFWESEYMGGGGDGPRVMAECHIGPRRNRLSRKCGPRKFLVLATSSTLISWDAIHRGSSVTQSWGPGP